MSKYLIQTYTVTHIWHNAPQTIDNINDFSCALSIFISALYSGSWFQNDNSMNCTPVKSTTCSSAVTKINDLLFMVFLADLFYILRNISKGTIMY